MKSPSFSPKGLPLKLYEGLQRVKPYGFVLFILFVAGLYGFVVLRINSLNNTEPSESAISSQIQATRIPKVDEHVVQQLKSLRDNSVNVNSLFENARSNPFQN